MYKLFDFFDDEGIKYITNVSLKTISTFKIGGLADVICYPSNANDVSKIIKYCNNNSVEYYTFGKCSNVVFSDDGVKKLIIKTDEMDTISHNGDIFEFGSGVMLAKASKYTIDHGYKGMEFSYGIPGSIGGAVYMNAGAYNGEMSFCVCKTEYVDDKGNICFIENEQHNFSKRYSYFTDKNFVITKTYVKLEKGLTDESLKLVDEFQLARKTKQPLEYPSAGSVFKRPEGYFAGKLIEDCNLKGCSVGGAMVSDKHAGFIINFNDATYNDVKQLVALIQRQVKSTFNVDLECEIKFID